MNSEALGRTTSFFQLMREPGFRIEIPKIQRDYAQGRASAENLRLNFLKTIKRHLDEERHLNLDFVYGSIQDDRFIPIDGQQRLTTLFLLHWYLGWYTGRTAQFKGYLIAESEESELQSVSRFTYETRVSSRDFCNQLLSSSFEPEPDTGVSILIRDQSWYYLHWDHDPNIEGMLNTLDSIEEVFDDAPKYYDLLLAESGLLTFQYIQLDDFGLSDQLYIKMNSRGKPLTDFENLKANVEELFKSENAALTTWFSNKIDKQWTDLFWGFRKQEKKVYQIDDLMMTFIRNCMVNIAAEHKGKEVTRELRDTGISFDFYLLQSLGCVETEILKAVFELLDCQVDDQGQFQSFLSDTNILDESELFKQFIFDDLNYRRRIQYAALVKFLQEYDDTEGLSDWMRLIRNLTEGTEFDTIDEYINGIRTLSNLLPHAKDIIDHIKDLKVGDFVGFSNTQAEEEIFKAQLIAADQSLWESRVKEIENHPYLRGSVLFVFLWTGLLKKNENKYQTNIDHTLVDQFDDYVNKLRLILTEGGVKWFKRNVLRRALLSIDDYTLPKGRNWSFVVDGFDRDISWRRLLGSDHGYGIKTLLEKIDTSSIELSLERLVESFQEKDDWRYYFIKYPEMMEVTGRDLFFRYNADDEIYMLSKTQMNGKHHEYYSFALCNALKKLDFEVQYETAAIEELATKYIRSINGVDTYIYYWPISGSGKDESGFWVEEDGDPFRIGNMEETLTWVQAKFDMNKNG